MHLLMMGQSALNGCREQDAKDLQSSSIFSQHCIKRMQQNTTVASPFPILHISCNVARWDKRYCVIIVAGGGGVVFSAG